MSGLAPFYPVVQVIAAGVGGRPGSPSQSLEEELPFFFLLLFLLVAVPILGVVLVAFLVAFVVGVLIPKVLGTQKGPGLGGPVVARDSSQGPGWWLASDGKWYPPELADGGQAAATSGESSTGSLSTARAAQSGGMPPGWYAAAGDPPGTQRYWDGTRWMSDPQPSGGSDRPGPPSANTVPKTPS